MTADPAGNFYVATGAVGTSLCGAGGSGALVIFPPTLETFRCLTLGAVLADSLDVAVGPPGLRAYMTLATGEVVLFPLQ
jgi:hypothetical protein